MKALNIRQIAALAGLAAAVMFGVGAALRTPPAPGGAGAETAGTAAQPRALAASYEHKPLPDAPAAPPSRLDAEAAFNPFGALSLGTPAALGQPATAASTPAPKKKPAVAAPTQPAPPPTAPPLPFVVIGALAGEDVTGGQLVAFIQQQDQLLVVRSGQSIGTSYRVESITPQKIDFTYLPLMQRQSLPLAP